VANGGRDQVRWIGVPPERIGDWLASFGRRHGGAVPAAGPDAVTFRAADGAVAQCYVPFPPLAPGSPAGAGAAPGDAGAAAAAAMAVHARAERVVGVLLVRLGGYAAGVFTGPAPELAASKVGSRLVHGRSAAGGTSQHRFARRREKQAAEALGAAAGTAAAVFGPYGGALDAVVLGGDRRAVAGLRADPRLREYFAIAVDRFLTVPDPRLAVLRATPPLFREIQVRLTAPGDAPQPGGGGADDG